MKSSDSPLVFWDHCIERRARINNLTAKDLFSLHGSNAHTCLTGEEGDMSALCKYMIGMNGAISGIKLQSFPLIERS